MYPCNVLSVCLGKTFLQQSLKSQLDRVDEQSTSSKIFVLLMKNSNRFLRLVVLMIKIKSVWWSCTVKPKNKTCLYHYGLQLLVMFILFAWAAVQLSIYYPWDQQLDPAGRFTVCWTRPTLCPRARSDSFTLLCGLAKNSSSFWTRSSTPTGSEKWIALTSKRGLRVII